MLIFVVALQVTAGPIALAPTPRAIWEQQQSIALPPQVAQVSPAPNDTGAAAKVFERNERERFTRDCFDLVRRAIDQKRYGEASKIRPLCD